MARELNINITTTADFDEIEKLAQAFDKLEKSVKSLNNVKGLTGIEKSFKSAQTSIKNMTTDVKALDKALTSVNKKLSAQSRTNVSGNVAKQQQNAATQAARAQQKVVNDAIKAQTAAYNAAAKSQKQQAAAAATATKNAAKAQAAAYTQQDAAVKRLSSSMSKMYRLQDRQQGVAGSSNTLLNRMEQTEQAYKRTIDLMNKSWNTTDAGAQSAVQRGLSRSLGEFNAQLKQTQQLQNVWTAHVRNVQRYRDELSKAEKDAQQFVQKQTAAASSAKDAPTRQQALDDVTKGMQQIESIQRKIQELDRQSTSGNEYFNRLGREAQRYTQIIEQAGQAQAAYHQRLQDLRTVAAQNSAAWDRMSSGVHKFITGLSSAAMAVAAFAANMRGKLNAAFSSASQLAGSLSSSIGGKFASMRATLDSTGKTFLGFGKSAKTGMSQANVALNEFFSAGWSLLASGSIVRMFGQNLLGNMYRGLADYQTFEQQMVRLGISGGMWNVKDANGNIDAQASNRAASSAGAMLPLEDLIFGIQSGRTRRVDPTTGAVSYEQGKGVRQFDTGQIADALYYFSSAVGADLRDQGPATAEALKPLLRVASFTQTDPETVIKGTLNAMMEFGYDPRALIKSGKTDTFDQVAGMVAIASNVSSMEVQDVFESFKMMGPLLNKLSGASEGAGLEDAMAAIFMASEVGLKGGNVGRGLDRLVSQLLDPDGPMQGVIKKYFGDDATMKNLFFNKDGTLQGGLKGVFDKIISKGLPEPELASLLSQLFTQNASRAAVGIIDPEKLTAGADVEGSWAWFKEQMKPENVERFMSNATAAMENTVSASITNMGNAWTMVKTMMIESVRGDLISGFTKLADVIWDIGYGLRDNPALARFIAYLGTMVGLFTTIVGSGMVLGGTILLIARAFSMLGGMLAPVLKVLMVLPGLLLTIAPILLALGLAAGIAFAAWEENLGGFQDRLQGFIDKLTWENLVVQLGRVLSFIDQLGAAFMEFVRGPLLGLDTSVENLQYMLQRVFGTWLGNLALKGLFDLGASIRKFFTDVRSGEGSFDRIHNGIEAIKVVAQNAGNALRGLGELFFFGTAQGENFKAIQAIGDALGIEQPITKAIVALNGLHKAFAIIGTYVDAFVASWDRLKAALSGTGINFGDILIAGIGAAIIFVTGLVTGFINTFTRLVNTVTSVVSRITQEFNQIAQSGKKSAGFIDDIITRFKAMGGTVEGVVSTIGRILGAYLGARLITALMPGFQMFTSLGYAAVSFGAKLLGVGAQAAIFAAKVATNLALIGVQLAAEVVALGISATAWAAKTAAEVISNSATAQGVVVTLMAAAAKISDAAASAAASGSLLGLVAATLSAVGATTMLVAILGLSIAAFGAIVLAAGLMAVGIFAVVAATDGFGAAISAVVQFVTGFWQGLQIAVTAAQAFFGAISAIIGPMLDLIAALTGSENRFQALGLAMGVLASVAAVSAMASIAGLIARFVLLFTTMDKGGFAIRGFALRFGLLGAAIMVLHGPFGQLLDWINQALERLGVLGDALQLTGAALGVSALAVGPKATAKGAGSIAKWGARVGVAAGGAAMASGVWAPVALAALPAALGLYMYSQQDVPPDIAQMQGFNEQMSGWLTEHDSGTVSDYAVKQLSQQGFSPKVEEWTSAAFDEYLKQISYVLGENALLTIAKQGDLPKGWFETYIGQGGTAGNIGRGNIEAIANKYLSSMSDQSQAAALRTSWGFDDGLLTAGDSFFQDTIGRQVQEYIAQGILEANKQYDVAKKAEENVYLQSQTDASSKDAQSYWGKFASAIDWVDTAITGEGGTPWSKGLTEALSLIGISPETGDFVPELEKLTTAITDPQFDSVLSSFLPGLKDYMAATNKWQEWQDYLSAFGGDVQQAHEAWMAAYGTPPPQHAPDPKDILGTPDQQKKAEEEYNAEDARKEFMKNMVENFDVSDYLAESVGQGLRAVFGDTTGAGAMGTFAETIMGNLQNLQNAEGKSILEANPWFNQDELMANAAIYGGGAGRTETGGKNLKRILRPMLEQTSEELGVNVDDLMKGIPQYYFDPALLATAQTTMFSTLERMDPQQGAILDALGITPDAQTGQVFSEMGMDWAALTQYAISTAMDGQDWDLSHYLMDAWGITHDQALSYLDQMGIDAQAIGNENFQAVEAAYLSSNGQVAAATTDFWNWMGDATQNGADMIVDITREEFEKIPEAWRILATNEGMRFNIIDESDVEHSAIAIDAWANSVKNASGALGDLINSPGVSALNQMLGTGGQPTRDADGNLSWTGGTPVTGGSWWDKPGTSFVETAANFNSMLAAGADNDAATKGLVETYDAANNTYTLLNELNGLKVVIPAPEYEAFKQGADEINNELKEMYQNYQNASKPGSANDPFGDSPLGQGGGAPVKPKTFEEWFAEVFDVEDFEVPTLPPDQAATFMTGVDYPATIQFLHDQGVEAGNAWQSGISNSMKADTQVEASLQNLVTEATAGMKEDITTSANEIASAFQTALALAFSGGPSTNGSQDPALSSAGLSDGSSSMATLAQQMVTDFQTAFQSGISNLNLDLSSIGAQLSSSATSWGTTAGAAFAAAFAIASASGQPPSNNGTQDPAIAGQDLGTTGPQPPTITVKVDMDHSLFDTGNTIVDTALDQIVKRQPKAKINMDHSLFDAGMTNVNLALGDITEHVSSAQVWMDGTIFFAGVYNVQSAMTSMGAAIASPQVWMDGTIFFAGVINVQSAMTTLAGLTASPTVGIIDNASGPLGTISDLLNGLTDRTVTVTTNYQTTGSPVPSGSGAGAATGIGGAAAEGGVVTWSGLTVVGEEGWELMDLPRGTRIYDHDTSKSMVADTSMLASSPFTSMKGGAMSAGSTSGVQVNIYNPVMTSGQNIRELSKQVSREIGKQIEATNKGQSPRTP